MSETKRGGEEAKGGGGGDSGGDSGGGGGGGGGGGRGSPGKGETKAGSRFFIGHVKEEFNGASTAGGGDADDAENDIHTAPQVIHRGGTDSTNETANM